MQKYAEQAVREHLQYLQPQFTAEKRVLKICPLLQQRGKRYQEFMRTAMKQTDRYRILNKTGVTKKILSKISRYPGGYESLLLEGKIDTTMTPWDSIRYYKGFLRAGFMAMNSDLGHVKAYVGGPDFAHFKYDMVSTGKGKSAQP